MDKNTLKAILVAITAAILMGFLTLVGDAAAADTTAYGWQADDGVLEFTDDPARIPPRYRGRAQELRLDLGDYPRLTVPDYDPDRGKARLRELRRLNGFDPYHPYLRYLPCGR